MDAVFIIVESAQSSNLGKFSPSVKTSNGAALRRGDVAFAPAWDVGLTMTLGSGSL